MSQQLAAAVRAHVLFHGDHPRDVFVTDYELRALEPENHRRVVGLRDAHQAISEHLIADGVASGIFDAPDVKIATYAIATMCTAVGTWYHPDGRLPIGEIPIDTSRSHCARWGIIRRRARPSRHRVAARLDRRSLSWGQHA